MSKAVLGLGSNIGSRSENLRSAIEALRHLPATSVERTSSFYSTVPVGYSNQRNFVNACVTVDTALSPEALLGACLGIEAAMGRERPFKNSPRIIDIDVLLYENVEINTPELSIPHPRIAERAFVLIPLGELYPEGKFFSFSFDEMLYNIAKDGVKKHIV